MDFGQKLAEKESSVPIAGDRLSLALLAYKDEAPSLSEPLKFLEKNVVNPLVNHAALEPYNTIASLAKAETKNQVLPEAELLDVPRAEFLSSAWCSQTVSSGVGMILPYALAGKAVGGSLRTFGATIGAEGLTARLLKNEGIANVCGAALYDGFRPLREGESRFGNVAGGVAAFTVFGVGNHLGRNLGTGWKIAARGATGFAGADSQLLVSRYLTNGVLPAGEELLQAGVAGMAMNNLLPPVQDVVTRQLSEAKFSLGFKTPADIYANTRFGADVARSTELSLLLEQSPWAYVQKGTHNEVSTEGRGTVKLAPGKSGPEELARGLTRLGADGQHEPVYRKAAALVRAGQTEPAWEAYKQARLIEETAAHHRGQVVSHELSGRDVLRPENLALEMGAWPAPGGVSYEMRWRQEFKQFIQSDGTYRPGTALKADKPFEPSQSARPAADRSKLSEAERVALEQRDVAVGLIQDLQRAGYIAVLAGGAVRDEYRGNIPKDYDIASSATPDQMEAVFAAKNYKMELTGKQFGVVRVRINGTDFEIATLRNDGNYTDGRRPDSVKFIGSLVEDGARRDLTLNAMYQDPLTNTIYDFFGGRRDIDAKTLRSVGDPTRRFAEDYLRMMRVPRLLSTKFTDFTVAPETMDGISANSHRLAGVAAERLRDEMRLMLTGKKPLLGLDLMMDTGLMQQLLPEVAALNGPKSAQDVVWHPEGNAWQHTRLVVEGLTGQKWETVLAGLLHDIGKPDTQKDWGEGRISNHGHAEVGAKYFLDSIAGRLKLTNQETTTVHGMILNHMRMHKIQEMSPSTLRQTLNLPYIEQLIVLQHADTMATTRPDRATRSMTDYIRAKQREIASGDASQRLDAKPLIGGDVLLGLGLKQSIRMGEIIKTAMAAQQGGEFTTLEGGLKWVRENIPELRLPSN